MQKVVDYKLVSDIEPPLLEKQVKNLMAEGWVPSGTVVAYRDMLIQAMVKFEEA